MTFISKIIAPSFRRFHLGAVTLSLCIFSVMYFLYVKKHGNHEAGSYLPLAVGSCVFFGVMAWVNFRSVTAKSASIRLAKAVGFAAAETIIFVLVFLFLLLNTIGI
jgi:hypothetical protein